MTQAASVLDVTGAAIRPDGHYYLSDERRNRETFVTWWRSERGGYTLYLETAGVYPGPEAERICLSTSGTVKAWPCFATKQAGVTCVPVGALRDRDVADEIAGMRLL